MLFPRGGGVGAAGAASEVLISRRNRRNWRREVQRQAARTSEALRYRESMADGSSEALWIDGSQRWVSNNY